MKKTLIILVIIIAIAVAATLVNHYVNPWISTTAVVSGIMGIVIGWILKILWDKYIADDIKGEEE